MRRPLLCGFATLGLLCTLSPLNATAQSGGQQDGQQDVVIVDDGWADPLLLPEVGVAGSNLTAVSSTAASSSPTGATRYVSVAPTRILDSRRSLGTPGRLAAGQTLQLAVVGSGGVPLEATAVVLNVTITDASEWGFVTAFPTGQPRPDASVINVERAGQTVANLATVPLGPDGSVQLFTSGATHLIADVQGYFVPAAESGPGRLISRSPLRILDTRSTGNKLAAGGDIELDVASLAGLPGDTDSVAVKITVTDSNDAGYWTAYPAGIDRPDVSNLNVGGAGQTIANQAIVRLTGGKFRVFSERGGHLIIDVVGSFTGPSGPVSAAGLFVPVAPRRLLDTRPGLSRPGFRRTFEIPVAGQFGMPDASQIAAVVVNTTITDSTPGFVSVWAARQLRPNASSLNASAVGQTIASHVITPVSGGGFATFVENGAHVIVDLSGWFVGAPLAEQVPPHIPLPASSGPAELGRYTYLYGAVPGGFAEDISNPAPSVRPVRWNACSPIRYAINLSGYSESYRADIEEAIDRLASATGLSFVNVADSSFIPQSAAPFEYDSLQQVSGSAPYDVLIVLTNEVLSDTVAGGVVGRARPIRLYPSQDSPGRFFHASLVIDVDDVSNRGVWSGYGVGQVLLHELGHVVGLGHTADVSQVMNPFISGATTYGYGDLRGLWQVGAAGGCG